MSQYFINGAKYAFSTTLSDLIAITEIANGQNPAITAATPPTEGDIILLESNWTDLNDLATFVGAGPTLDGIDTTDTSWYPVGESAGSYRTVGGFTSLSQITDISQSGGDVNTYTWGYIDDRSPRQRSKPTDQNPLVLTFTMDYDPNLPWADALEDLSRSRQLVTMRETLPSGDVLLYTGYLSYQKSPTRTRNENMKVTAVMSVNSDILRFPASYFSGS